MKRVLPIVVALVVSGAVPAWGAEEKRATGTAAAPAAQTDSPLVAAAKRTKRKGKKASNVITNETLRQSGANARVTTTAVQRPFVVPKAYEPPAPTPEMVAAREREQQKRAAATAQAARTETEEARRVAAAAAAAAAEEGFYDDGEADPAQAEKAQQDANQQKPPRN